MDVSAGLELGHVFHQFIGGVGLFNRSITIKQILKQYPSKRRTLDRFRPESFVKDAVLLDLTNMKPRQLIDDGDLEAAEEGAGLALREGEIALIHTGWDGNVGSEEYWSSHPALSENGADYLSFKRVSGVGVNMPSIDQPGNQALPAHTILMRNGICVLEHICNLDLIDQPRFRLIALPLRIKASVSPARALALLDDKT